MTSDGPSLELWPDSEPAWWVTERVSSIALDVRALVPPEFEAYARVFHPARRFDGSDGTAVTWAEVASANRRTAHPEMQWPHISGAGEASGLSAPGLWDEAPVIGSLPLALARTMAGVLSTHTDTPEQAWFAVWDGWGGLTVRPDDGSWEVLTATPPRSRVRRVLGALHPGHFGPWRWNLLRFVPHRRRKLGPEPTVLLPNREYHLLAGPVSAAAVSASHADFQSASLWWPDDHAWFVATEIDLCSTYVGGTAACIDAIVSHPDVEAMRVELDHGITYDADHVNPPPATPFM